MISLQHDGGLYGEEVRDCEKNERPHNLTNVDKGYYESIVQYLLEELGSKQIQLQHCLEEQRYGPSHKVSYVTDNYYVKDIVDTNKQQAKTMNPHIEVVELHKFTYCMKKMQHDLEEDLMSYIQSGQTDEGVLKEK